MVRTDEMPESGGPSSVLFALYTMFQRSGESFKEDSPLVERYSIDECFMDLTGHCRNKSFEETAWEIRNVVVKNWVSL